MADSDWDEPQDCEEFANFVEVDTPDIIEIAHNHVKKVQEKSPFLVIIEKDEEYKGGHLG